MTVQDVVDMAKHGELKQLSLADEDDVILSFINLGILELYKRFEIETEEVIIQLGIATIVSDQYQMISNTIYEMPNDYMYIICAHEEDGSDISINEESDLLTINTVGWNRIQIPTPTKSAYISIIYASEPSVLNSSNLTDRIKLPPQLIEALLHYVGYRGHGSIDGSINTENNTHYQRFEKSCNKVKADGTFNYGGLSTMSRFKSSGMV